MREREWEAGRYLDIMIAKEIMGWVWIAWQKQNIMIPEEIAARLRLLADDELIFNFVSGYKPLIDGVYYYSYRDALIPSAIPGVPYYHRDLNALVRVIEKLKEKHLYLTFNDTLSGWRAAFFPDTYPNPVSNGPRPYDMQFYTFDTTPALAIAYAALRVVRKLKP
jgi:hypothetical protein